MEPRGFPRSASASNMNRYRLTSWIPIVIASVSLTACIALNSPPVAQFARTPASGEAPLAVFFDAADSIDSDGSIVSYAWTFGDGSAGTGMTTTHVYTTAGTFEATLTVTDNRGDETDFARAVTVVDPADPPATGIDVGMVAPGFALNQLDGPETTLAEFRGLVVLLDFWRSTCTPCLLTMPHLEALRAKYADQGLVVIAVNLDITEAAAIAYMAESGFDEFIVLRGTLAEAEAVRATYGVAAIPHTFVIDRQGIVRHADHPIRLRDRHIEPWL
ncbi:PKD domain-containing protein [Candidatus Bipolaricaulota bacterium]